ncbi:hypothetical protein [Candidatus Lokiarchaeum ossiferum]|uniref:hypothetical protein n=1 Tax=Candidatus Lokiarchaeum ossiferum TaxID=2951803 RepID=UPI00352D7A9D
MASPGRNKLHRSNTNNMVAHIENIWWHIWWQGPWQGPVKRRKILSVNTKSDSND